MDPAGNLGPQNYFCEGRLTEDTVGKGKPRVPTSWGSKKLC